MMVKRSLTQIISSNIIQRSFSKVTNEHKQLFKQAAKALNDADAVYITAGAGMGVDSGLPDFRSDKGFWRAYPPLSKLNIGFMDMANPIWFETNPKLAWGFYGHRLKLYEATAPHLGYKMLLQMANNTRFGYFVYTSNVDGHFEKSGFDQNHIVECHGSIHYLQCVDGSCIVCDQIKQEINGIIKIEELCALNNIHYKQWLNDYLIIDEDTFQIKDDELLPKCLLNFVGKSGCLHKKNISRPNILMFNDMHFKTDRVYQQYEKLDLWKDKLRKNNVNNLCVIEMGAGSMVPRVRYDSDSAASNPFCQTFIRINTNPSEATINPKLQSPNKIQLPFGALFSLNEIYDEWLKLQQL